MSSGEPLADQAPRSTVPAPSYAYRIPTGSYSGATSCASASCHGGNDPSKRGSEYTTWIEHDPHSRAYNALLNEVSQKISRKLVSFRNGKHIPAHEDALCLKCHSLPVEQPSEPSIFTRQGVSCESCHGPAESWRTTHYQPSFFGSSHAEKAEQGMYPTKDLAFRVTMCASCHVGDGSREVNHDLIAAGHPRLMFEYSSYHHHPKYRPHWKETAYGSDFEARAWAIGQVAVARSAVDLLRTRAERSQTKEAPWPELTEYSCYACHKDLNPNRDSWRQLSLSDRPVGALPWGTRTIPVLPALAEHGADLSNGQKQLLTELRRLHEMMELQPADAKQIAAQSRAALAELDGWLRQMQQSAERDSRARPMTRFGPLFHELSDNALSPDGTKFNNLDWDGVVQHYLGLRALQAAGMTESPPLAELRKLLLFPDCFNSPRDSDPAAILKQFQRLRERPAFLPLPRFGGEGRGEGVLGERHP